VPLLLLYFNNICTQNSTAKPIAVIRLTTEIALILIAIPPKIILLSQIKVIIVKSTPVIKAKMYNPIAKLKKNETAPNNTA